MTTVPEDAATNLPFPFVELTDPQVAFNRIPNYMKLVEALPPEFASGGKREWERAVTALRGGGWTPARQKRALELLITEDPAVFEAQTRYLSACLSNFEFKEETKIAVCAWLLSLMFKKCPSW